MATFKLALDAGHGMDTSGRRCLKSLDPEEHREWWLNDRVCRYIAQAEEIRQRVEARLASSGAEDQEISPEEAMEIIVGGAT